ncbi:MAG: NosL family protein [Desulfuromonadales bacterium GWD2_54_10]|nr:MAG: NosL family protein [Desulfuromonadales bacterium GWD2_54_10]
MYRLLSVACGFWLLLVSSLALAAPPADVSQSPACRYCGMDRGKFNHSRMLVEYEDGSQTATCSLHCAAVELANTIDRTPVNIRVADFDTKELINVDSAVWVMGGSKSGVMTARAKWAFASREAAERFVKANGGVIGTFDEAIKAAYEDMYQDTKAIRERRMMKRLKQHGGAPPL